MTSVPPIPPASAAIDAIGEADRNDGATPGDRRVGLTTVAEGLACTAVGGAALWISFWLGDSAKTILGAGPLIGGGMIGYGSTQALFGPSLRPLRWVAAVIGGVVVVAMTVILLEMTLGVTFA
jgi:hypothetical protein